MLNYIRNKLDVKEIHRLKFQDKLCYCYYDKFNTSEYEVSQKLGIPKLDVQALYCEDGNSGMIIINTTNIKIDKGELFIDNWKSGEVDESELEEMLEAECVTADNDSGILYIGHTRLSATSVFDRLGIKYAFKYYLIPDDVLNTYIINMAKVVEDFDEC